MAALFDPMEIRGVRLRNRIAVSPMCQYSSEDGFASDWHLVHLGSRAVGGAGLVFTEASAVTAQGRISPNDLGIYRDDHVEMLSKITGFVKSHGAAAGIQLAHAGRKASTGRPWEGGGPLTIEQGGWSPIIAPSAIPFTEGYAVPEALTEEGIAGVVAGFEAAARRALDAGFDVIEIHAAHGYLLHEFLSPLVNQRTDGYGGSFANRTRIVREVAASIRKVWPEKNPLFIRFSVTDWAEGGWDPDQSVELARELKPIGVDLVDCSSAGAVPGVTIPVGPGYQTGFAERVRREAGILTGAVGMITSPEQADTIVRTGQADMVLLARAMLRDPYWPSMAAKTLGQAPPAPAQYARAW